MITSYNSSKLSFNFRNGKKNGFNFNEHKNDKIGILRAWNKKHKKDEGPSGPGRKKKTE